MDSLGLANLFGDSGIRTFGWVEGGYTGASTGAGIALGPAPAEPLRRRVLAQPDRLGDPEAAPARPVRPRASTCGISPVPTRPWAQPKGGIGFPPGNPHFGQDFRDLYLSAHLPILTDGGVDVKIGRMNTIIGYNGFLAPYRPFYSSDYQFFYSQDGAFTGFLTDLHVNNRLDIWNGMTLGANTFFTLRSQ